MSYSVRQWFDRASWNEFVSSVPDSHFQQTWEWGELAPHLGGRAVRLGLHCNGELHGALQLFVNPIQRVGKTYLYAPRGPALERVSVERLGPLLDAAREIGLEEQALGIRVEPNAAETDDSWKRALSALGLHRTYPPSQPRSSWVLDLQPEPDQLLAGMKQKTRYNIRLAGRKGVEIREGTVHDLDAFYDLYRQTAERDDFFVHDISLYRCMFDLFRASGAFCMLLAYHGDALIAAVTLIHIGSTCWYVHGASSNQHRNLMATYLLQWESIKRAKDWGCTLYDFRAVPDILQEDQDMYGVYRFKEGFGGRQLTTLHTYTAAYQYGWFGLWQLYFSGRFSLENRRRARLGLPIRQFA